MVLGRLVAARSGCLPLSQQLVQSVFVSLMVLVLVGTWSRRMHQENCSLPVGISCVLVVLGYLIRSKCVWFRLGDSLNVLGGEVSASCEHLSGACICGTAAIVDDVVGSGATEEPLPRLERTSHTRPPTDLERSIVHNEWAKGYQLFTSSPLPFPSFSIFVFFCGLFFACSLSRTIPLVLTTLYFAAGLSEVPTGAVCLSSSQVLAFGQAAVRLERSRDQRKEQTLTRRKSLFVSVVSVFLSLFGSCF